MTATLSKTKTSVSVQEITHAASSVATKGGLTVMTGVVALVSLWAVACFAIAAIGHGPMALIQSWFNAIVG